MDDLPDNMCIGRASVVPRLGNAEMLVEMGLAELVAAKHTVAVYRRPTLALLAGIVRVPIIGGLCLLVVAEVDHCLKLVELLPHGCVAPDAVVYVC